MQTNLPGILKSCVDMAEINPHFLPLLVCQADPRSTGAGVVVGSNSNSRNQTLHPAPLNLHREVKRLSLLSYWVPLSMQCISEFKFARTAEYAAPMRIGCQITQLLTPYKNTFARSFNIRFNYSWFSFSIPSTVTSYLPKFWFASCFTWDFFIRFYTL